MTAPPRQRRDCRCPRARHQHGTHRAYQADRCRCFLCRVAHANATRTYRHGGSWREAYVDATETKLQLRALAAVGVTARRIAAHSGLSIDMIEYLRGNKTRQVMPEHAATVARTYDALWLKGRNDRDARRCSTIAANHGHARDPLDIPAWAERVRLIEVGVSPHIAAIIAERLGTTSRTVQRRRSAA